MTKHGLTVELKSRLAADTQSELASVVYESLTVGKAEFSVSNCGGAPDPQEVP